LPAQFEPSPHRPFEARLLAAPEPAPAPVVATPVPLPKRVAAPKQARVKRPAEVASIAKADTARAAPSSDEAAEVASSDAATGPPGPDTTFLASAPDPIAATSAPDPTDVAAAPDPTAVASAPAGDAEPTGAMSAGGSEREGTGAPAPRGEYPVRRVRLAYDLLHGESATRVGQVVHTFRSDGVRYEAEAVAEAVGFVSLVFRGRFVQRSRGAIGPSGLVPEEYTLERGRGDPPERAVFDWEDAKVDLAWREERRSVALPAGAQDPLSVLHQLYFMQPLPASARLAIASSRKLGRYVYAVLDQDEALQTPMGHVRTLHVGRVEADGSVLEVWLDRDRDLLPVRIYSRDRKGTILDQVVREVTTLEERPLAGLQ
jgi:hypothetical protein